MVRNTSERPQCVRLDATLDSKEGLTLMQVCHGL